MPIWQPLPDHEIVGLDTYTAYHKRFEDQQKKDNPEQPIFGPPTRPDDHFEPSPSSEENAVVMEREKSARSVNHRNLEAEEASQRYNSVGHRVYNQYSDTDHFVRYFGSLRITSAMVKQKRDRPIPLSLGTPVLTMKEGEEIMELFAGDPHFDSDMVEFYGSLPGSTARVTEVRMWLERWFQMQGLFTQERELYGRYIKRLLLSGADLRKARGAFLANYFLINNEFSAHPRSSSYYSTEIIARFADDVQRARIVDAVKRGVPGVKARLIREQCAVFGSAEPIDDRLEGVLQDLADKEGALNEKYEDESDEEESDDEETPKDTDIESFMKLTPSQRREYFEERAAKEVFQLSKNNWKAAELDGTSSYLKTTAEVQARTTQMRAEFEERHRTWRPESGVALRQFGYLQDTDGSYIRIPLYQAPNIKDTPMPEQVVSEDNAMPEPAGSGDMPMSENDDDPGKDSDEVVSGG